MTAITTNHHTGERVAVLNHIDSSNLVEPAVSRLLNMIYDKVDHYSSAVTDGYKTQLEETKEMLALTEEELNRVTKEFEEYRDINGDGKTWKSIAHIDWLQETFDWDNTNFHRIIGRSLTKLSKEIAERRGSDYLPKGVMDSPLNRYHIDAIEVLHHLVNTDPDFLAEYRK